MDGKIIIEIYEYAEDLEDMPDFEYIPCDLATCMKGKSTTLKELIRHGFDELPKKTRNEDKLQEIFGKLEDADISRIDVAYHPAKTGYDAYVELTNVEPVSMMSADIRYIGNKKNKIVLKGRYRLSEGNEVTKLKDAQRLTLIYSSGDSDDGNTDDETAEKEICLNITFLQ